MPEYEEFMHITCDILDLESPEEIPESFAHYVGEMNLLAENAGGGIRSRQIVAMCLVNFHRHYGKTIVNRTDGPKHEEISDFMMLIQDTIGELANEKAAMARGEV